MSYLSGVMWSSASAEPSGTKPACMQGPRTDQVLHSIVGTVTQSGVVTNSLQSAFPGAADCPLPLRARCCLPRTTADWQVNH